MRELKDAAKYFASGDYQLNVQGVENQGSSGVADRGRLLSSCLNRSLSTTYGTHAMFFTEVVLKDRRLLPDKMP